MTRQSPGNSAVFGSLKMMGGRVVNPDVWNIETKDSKTRRNVLIYHRGLLLKRGSLGY